MKIVEGVVLLCMLGGCLGAGSTTQAAETEGEGEGGADASGQVLVHRLYNGYPFTLICNLTNIENISFSLEWSKDGNKLEEGDSRIKIFPANSSLLIDEATKEDVGMYVCKTGKGIPSEQPLNKTFQVIYYEVRRMGKSLNLQEKDDLELECPVEGSPLPVVAWFKDAQPLNTSETKVVLDKNTKGVPKAKLTIYSVSFDHRGNYSCIVTTLKGPSERYTFVRVKDMYAALWPFIGIVIEVVLLGIIIFIFEKRRAKAEFEESDTDQGNDQ